MSENTDKASEMEVHDEQVYEIIPGCIYICLIQTYVFCILHLMFASIHYRRVANEFFIPT